MKQRITIEQLKQLSEDQQARLREFWEPLDGDWIAQVSNNYLMLIDQGSMEVSPKETIKREFLPLLTIGQMIELLSIIDEDDEEDNYEGKENETADDPIFRISWKPDEELADLLWESVKALL